jgi:hypothetical protein
MNSFYRDICKKGLVFLLFQSSLLGAFGQSNCLSLNATVTNATCFGASTGAIALTPSGGSGTYSYLWKNGSGNTWTTQNPSGLPAGDYAVVVKDANNTGCSASQHFTIAQPEPLNIVGIDKTWHNGFDLSCPSSNDGELTIWTSGGTAPYQYSLNDGNYKTENVFSNLPAGTYYATVKDAKGCYVTSNPNSSLPQSVDYIIPLIDIVPPAPLSATPLVVLPTPPSNGVDTFTIMPTQLVTLMAGQVNGGTGNYRYNWTSPASISDPISTSIMVAPTTTTTYTLTITDNNNCSMTQKATLVVSTIIGSDNLNNGDMYVCHNGKALKISPKAIPAHLQHGDYIGSCRPWTASKSAAAETHTVPTEVSSDYHLAPNPSSGTFILQLPYSETATYIMLMNSNGILQENRRVLPTASRIQRFDLAALPAGTYFIRIVNGSNSKTLKAILK